MNLLTDVLSLDRVPPEFREVAEATVQNLVTRFPHTLAVVVIGSVAEGGFRPESDLDMVWVVRGRLRRTWWREIETPHERRVQVIPWLLKTANWHFARRTTLAHSVHRGLIVYDPEGRAAQWQARPLGLPDREWMREWFKHWLQFYEAGFREDLPRAREWRRKFGEEHVHVYENLARVSVNFAILLIETRGVVPTCKQQLWTEFQRLTSGPKLRQAMDTALRIHREDRWMSWEEAQQIIPLVHWLRRRLEEALQ
jgi:hypothetical protein